MSNLENEKPINVYGETANDIYKGLEKHYDIPKGFATTKEESELVEADYFFMIDDANELLANIGLEQNLDFNKIPTDQLMRIFRYYHLQSETKEEGKTKYNDPLPYYKVGDASRDEELYKFGYELGKLGNIGIYYRLLPDNSFRHGYWTGKMERAVELNNDDLIVEVGREIKVFDANTAEEELGNIVNNIFKEEKGKSK